MKAFFSIGIYVILIIGLNFQASGQTLAAVKRGEKWYFIDKKGAVVFNRLFEDVGEKFVNGLAPVKIEGKWGYINSAGKTVIKPIYLQAHIFHNGRALVQKAPKKSTGLILDGWMYIDVQGKKIKDIEMAFANTDTFSEGIFLVETSKGKSYILPSGKMLSPDPKYSDLQPFSNGLARVKKGGKFGYIDTSGNLKIPFLYDAATNFLDKMACVNTGINFEVINTNGETVSPLPVLDDVSAFNRGMAVVPMHLKYFVYKLGTKESIPIELSYGSTMAVHHVYPFSEDIARFFGQSYTTGFLFGYILPDGKLLNGYRYQWANNFSEGMASVRRKDHFGFINTKGEEVIEAIFDDARNFYKVE